MCYNNNRKRERNSPLKKRKEDLIMRTIFYYVSNSANKTTFVGRSQKAAEEKCAEMAKANPNETYRVIYKWASI